MNCWNAALTVVASELEELLEDVPEVEAEEVEEVLLEDESVALLEELPITPLDCNASMTAAMSPPPDGGGGALVELVALLSPAALLD